MPYWRFLCGALAFACNESPLGLLADAEAFARASAQAIDALVTEAGYFAGGPGGAP